MNITDLKSELASSSQDCSSDVDIRAAVDRAIANHAERRRHITLTAAIAAAAAAVVIIAGSVALVGTHVSSAPAARPATHEFPPPPPIPTVSHQSNPHIAPRTHVAVVAPVAGTIRLPPAHLLFPVDLAHLGAAWSVLARTDSVNLAVDVAGSGKDHGVQGEVQYAADPSTIVVPADATSIVLAGHSGKTWTQNKTDGQIKASTDPSDGYQVFGVWQRPDGAVKIASDTLGDLALVARLVQGDLHPIAPLVTASVTTPGYTHASSMGTALNMGGPAVGQLCPSTRSWFDIDPAVCIVIYPASKGTTLAQVRAEPAHDHGGISYSFATFRASTVAGRQVLIAPDGESVLTTDLTGRPLLVTAPRRSTVSTEALTAIALGIQT